MRCELIETVVVVRLTVRPVDNGVGKLDQLEFVLVAVRDEVRHLVKGGEQRRAQQHDIVKVENCVHGHHRFDDVSGRCVYCGVSVTAQFRCPLFFEASQEGLCEIGLALNGEQVFGTLELVH